MEPVVDWILAHGPAQIISVASAREQVQVLAYHGIDRPERFEDHVKYLLRYHHPVSLDDLIRACNGLGELPRHAVLLSFDDGDPSLMSVVLPLFRERGIPGVAFVISDLLDSNQPTWWSEVETLLPTEGPSKVLLGADIPSAVRALKQMLDTDRTRMLEELRSSAVTAPHTAPLTQTDLAALETCGISIGSHTSTHPCLPRCTATKVEAEIRDSHSRLESALGHPPKAFAYPNGDWDSRAEPILKELGYEAAFLFDHRTNPLPIANPLRISRLRVDSATSMDRFRTIVSGLHPALHRLRGGK
jgi:peptidoglycan/xylan/chitin deacetylase (PgdA/CDA1 family)